MNWPAIALILVAVSGLAGFGAGVKWQKGLHAEAELERKLGWADALDATAKELAKIKIEQRNVTIQAKTIVEKEQVYSECKNTPEMVQTINSALKGGTK